MMKYILLFSVELELVFSIAHSLHGISRAQGHGGTDNLERGRPLTTTWRSAR